MLASDVAGAGVSEGKRVLLEDHLLRGFPPIAPGLQLLQFQASGQDTLSTIQEVSIMALVLVLDSV